MQRNAPPVPVPVDSSIAIKMTIGNSMYQEKALMARADVWHKIKILRGARYDKEVVLQAILNVVEPADLIPVKYQVNGEDTFFLARNCGSALERLCKSSLIIKTASEEPLILLLTLAFASIHDLKVSIQPLLLSALTRRYDPNKKSLNLERFHKDPEIDKIVYCPLSQIRTFNHILKLAKSALATFEHLNLQHNELLNLTAVESSNLSSIRCLDLRHNNLMTMDVLTPLRCIPITRIWLDGNPLCENYSNPKQYIESARRYILNLVELDGVCTGEPSMPVTYKNYFKDSSRESLVHQFISHYFYLYDQPDRTVLKGLYDKDAFYSLSLSIPNSVLHKKNLGHFTANRNLKRTDHNKKNQNLHHGDSNILTILKRLPRSFHDKNTFTCDLMYDDGMCLAISVQGLFKNLHGESHVLFFNRTFVLLAREENEYNIINDQYHVSLPPEGITSDSVKAKISFEEFVPMCFSAKEKLEITKKFVDITALNADWSRTYLQETNYNLRKSISNFMKDYKTSAVPSDAFVN